MPSAEPTWRIVELAPDARPDFSHRDVRERDARQLGGREAHADAVDEQRHHQLRCPPPWSVSWMVVKKMPIASSAMPRVTVRRGP